MTKYAKYGLLVFIIGVASCDGGVEEKLHRLLLKVKERAHETIEKVEAKVDHSIEETEQKAIEKLKGGGRFSKVIKHGSEALKSIRKCVDSADELLDGHSDRNPDSSPEVVEE